MTRLYLSSTFSVFVLMLCTLSSAQATSISRSVGSIPTDVREISSGSTLKSFPHQPWLTGSSIAFLPDESRLVVADTQNSAVVVVHPTTGVVHARVAVGQRPERLVVAPDGLVYVTNRGSRSFSVVDPVRGREIRAVSAGVEPFGIALTPDTRKILITSSATGELLVFDRRGFHLSFRIKLSDRWPAAVTAHPDGKRAYVTHMFDPRVSVIDMRRQRTQQTLVLPHQDTGLPQRLMGARRSKRTSNLAFSATVSPGGNRLFVAHVMADTGAAVAGLGRSDGYGLGNVTPLVATVSTFDLTTNRLIRPNVTFQRRASRRDINVHHQQMLMMSQPMAVVHNPRSAQLLMVGHGCDKVAVLNSRFSDPVTMPLGGFNVGHAPKGVAVSRTGSTAFVHNSHSFSVSSVDLKSLAERSNGHAARNPAARWQGKATRQFVIARDPLPDLAKQGRRLFTHSLNNRVGGRNRFACASCHPDGRHDGLTWQIGAGPRKTPILAARVQGTGPFNWLGTENHLKNNVKQTVRRLGGHGINDTEAKAISTYISLYMNGFDNPNRGQNAFLVARGQQIFEDDTVGCSTCHDSRNNFTDGSNHNVGTTTSIEKQIWRRFKHLATQRHPGAPPRGLDRPPFNRQIRQKKFRRPPPRIPEQLRQPPIAYNTPSLRHVWAQVSYLHDGSQRTLKQLITTGNAGNRMGKTSHLSASDIDALVAYLKSL